MPRIEDTMRVASLRGLALAGLGYVRSTDATLATYAAELRTAIDDLGIELLRTEDAAAARTVRQLRTRLEQTASAIERTRDTLGTLKVDVGDLEYRASAALIIIALEGEHDADI
jgi:hypothetical protein